MLFFLLEAETGTVPVPISVSSCCFDSYPFYKKREFHTVYPVLALTLQKEGEYVVHIQGTVLVPVLHKCA
jgi:hypothetical protein